MFYRRGGRPANGTVSRFRRPDSSPPGVPGASFGHPQKIDPVFIGGPLGHSAHLAGRPFALTAPDDADHLARQLLVGRLDYLADGDFPVGFDVEALALDDFALRAAAGDPSVL